MTCVREWKERTGVCVCACVHISSFIVLWFIVVLATTAQIIIVDTGWVMMV